jgi:hypothetical protein
MQGTRQFLELVRDHDLVAGSLRGVFHIAIGRRIFDPNGQLIAGGVTWRELAALLKEVKFDRELVRELGADPETLSPKDREKFWYNAISVARVDGDEARQQAEVLTKALRPHGLIVGPPPSGTTKGSAPTDMPPDMTETPKPNAAGKKRKKP